MSDSRQSGHDQATAKPRWQNHPRPRLQDVDSQVYDGVNASVNILNDLLQTYMPLQVGWTIGQMSNTLKLAELTVRLERQAGMTVTATSDSVPRKQLDSLRHAHRNTVEAALIEPSWSTMGFGVLLLQLGEDALSHVKAFNTSRQLLELQHLGYTDRPGDKVPGAA